MNSTLARRPQNQPHVESIPVACTAEYPGYEPGAIYRAAWVKNPPTLGHHDTGLWSLYKQGQRNTDLWFLHDRLTPEEFTAHFKPINK